jgi:hypothetical protein
MKSSLVSNTVVKPRPMKPTLLIKKSNKSFIILTIPSLYSTDTKTIAGIVVWNDGTDHALNNSRVGEYSYDWIWDNFEVLDTAKSLTLVNE